MERVIEVRSPATGELVGKVPAMSVSEVREEIERAVDGFEEISRTPLYRRAAILRRVSEILEERKEELARLLAMEAGKPVRDARVEVLRASRVFRQAAEEAPLVLEGRVHRVDAYEYPPGNENRLVMTVREPVGVVAAILPFNFPLNSMAHKVAPAIAAGNSVVVKPSSLTPLSALKLREILVEAGLPDNAVRVVTGYSGEIGGELVENEAVSLITFTGSTEVGLRIASAAVARGKRVIMELGGSDPMIVLDDADVERAARVAVRARYEYAGQNCNAAKRIIVHERVADEFIRLFESMASKLRLGDPLREDTDVGPVISREAVDRLDGFVEDARAKGGKVKVLVERPGLPGSFYPVTVVEDAGPEMEVMRREVFGPIAPIAVVSSDDEAVKLANSTEYGLQAAIFTRDLERALQLAREIKAGGVIINDSTRLRWDSLPFGGVKRSGIGREGVRDTMLEMTEVKLIAVTFTRRYRA